MAYMELAANVGSGTRSFQETSSWTDSSQYGSTLYKTYQFTASAAAGWTFARWEVRSRESYSTSDGSYTGNWSSWSPLSTSATFTREFTCESESHGTAWGDSRTWYDREVRAVFTQNTYTYTVAVHVSTDSPNGSGSVSGGGSFHYGDSCTVTATASSGFKFKKWTASDSAQAAALSTSASYTFTVTANVTLYAHFKVGGTGQLIHGSSNTLLHGSSGTLLYDD